MDRIFSAYCQGSWVCRMTSSGTWSIISFWALATWCTISIRRWSICHWPQKNGNVKPFSQFWMVRLPLQKCHTWKWLRRQHVSGSAAENTTPQRFSKFTRKVFEGNDYLWISQVTCGRMSVTAGYYLIRRYWFWKINRNFGQSNQTLWFEKASCLCCALGVHFPNFKKLDKFCLFEIYVPHLAIWIHLNNDCEKRFKTCVLSSYFTAAYHWQKFEFQIIQKTNV